MPVERPRFMILDPRFREKLKHSFVWIVNRTTAAPNVHTCIAEDPDPVPPPLYGVEFCIFP